MSNETFDIYAASASSTKKQLFCLVPVDFPKICYQMIFSVLRVKKIFYKSNLTFSYPLAPFSNHSSINWLAFPLVEISLMRIEPIDSEHDHITNLINYVRVIALLARKQNTMYN